MSHIGLAMTSTRIPLLKFPISEKLSLTTTKGSSCQLLVPSDRCTCTCIWLSSHHKSSNRIITNCYSYSPNPPAAASTLSPDSKVEEVNEKEKFDWYAHWYPVMPVCNLDKRKPLGMRVIGLDVVVWWDRTKSQWKVFNDMCPHRLAPLSQGRIDQQGRLQCVYHGWCFSGSGNCELIPQAPPDGPPVHTSKKACAAVYPSTVQNGIVWFWPNSNPEAKDILNTKKPFFIPELDDPSYSSLINIREMNYGYEILMENLMDPAHVPYAHYGILTRRGPKNKATKDVDREGGKPLNLGVQNMGINGFSAQLEWGVGTFFAPCVYYGYPVQSPSPEKGNGSSVTDKAAVKNPPRTSLVFLCIPVSPGKSRLIWSFPRNFAVWTDKIIPKWVLHINQNLVLDSDLYLLHVEEQHIMKFGPTNWQKACFVPTKADAVLIGYRRWLNKYSNGGVDWGSKFNGGALPPTPPREVLLDRYWTHVVNCPSCNSAYKGLNITETALQVIAFGLIGVVALSKQGMINTIQRTAIFTMAIVCFAASKWLSRFIYRTFHFHDYSHALK